MPLADPVLGAPGPGARRRLPPRHPVDPRRRTAGSSSRAGVVLVSWPSPPTVRSGSSASCSQRLHVVLVAGSLAIVLGAARLRSRRPARRRRTVDDRVRRRSRGLPGLPDDHAPRAAGGRQTPTRPDEGRGHRRHRHGGRPRRRPIGRPAAVPAGADDDADTAIRRAGRTTGAAAAAGKRAVDEHRPAGRGPGQARRSGEPAGWPGVWPARRRHRTTWPEPAQAALTTCTDTERTPLDRGTETDDRHRRRAGHRRADVGGAGPSGIRPGDHPGIGHGRGGRRGGLRALVRQRRRRRPPTTGWSWSTWAASSCPARSTARFGRGPTSTSTPPSTPTGTSTTSSACTAGRPRPPSPRRPGPGVVAHEAVAARFDRYIRDRRLQRRGQPPAIRYRRPRVADRVPLPRRARSGTGSTSTSAASGPSSTTTGARPTTTPGPGCPASKVLCTGDLFIWASPNAGNPQKVQRYPLEWAEALRRMLALYDSPAGGPEVLLPGHGYPIIGEPTGSAGPWPRRPNSSSPWSPRPSSS